MRIAALLLGLLGSFLIGIAGILWTEAADNIKEAEQIAETYRTMAKDVASATGKGESKESQAVFAQLETLRKKARAAYPMVLCGFVGFIASAFVLRFPKLVGGIMTTAAIVPAVLAPLSLLFGSVLLLGALFAFLAKPKPAA